MWLCSCSIGIVLPVYKTFKAIEKKDQDEQQRWLLYWAGQLCYSLYFFVICSISTTATIITFLLYSILNDSDTTKLQVSSN